MIITAPIKLDVLVYDYYGDVNYLPQVLSDNPHLINTHILQVGDEVILKDYQPIVKKQLPRLWD